MRPAPAAAARPTRPGLRHLRAVVALAAPWRGELRYGVASGVSQQVLFVGGASVAAYAAGRAVLGATYDDLTFYLLGLVVVVVLQVRTPWLEAISFQSVANRVQARLRGDVFAALHRLTPAGLAGRRSGDLGATAMNDVTVVQRFFAESLPALIVALILPALGLVAVAALSWRLALVLLPFLLLAGALPLRHPGGAGRGGADGPARAAGLSAEVVDDVQGLREILAFGAGAEVVAGYGRLEVPAAGGRPVRAGAERVVVELLTTAGGLAVLGVGTALVRHHQLSRTLLPPVAVLAVLSFGPVSRLVHAARDLGAVAAAGERIFTLLDAPAPAVDPVGPSPAALPSRPGVEFRDVGFRYRPDLPDALTGVSFTVGPGETVALAGPSGAGKSTCVNLLLRFWAAASGAVLVGGVDVGDLPDRCLHTLVGLVPQDVYLFNTTIRDNLRLGRPDASDREIEVAARDALAWEFVTALPDGLDTRTGERGVALSGGQRQRLAIARAFLADPPVLVLDEPVSSLDADNELALTEAMSRIRRGRATIVVAHRLSTLRAADRIVVLEQGRVVETGTHADLLGRSGPYRALVASQLA